MADYLKKDSSKFQARFQKSLNVAFRAGNKPTDQEVELVKTMMLAHRDYQLDRKDHKKLKALLHSLDALAHETPGFYKVHAILEELFGQALLEESNKQRLKKWVGKLTKEWASVNVTDIPTGNPGKYTFTPQNEISESDRNNAIQSMGGPVPHMQTNPEYWLRLGYLISQRTEKYGRCFSCAAFVIYSLVMIEDLDDLLIEHVGAAKLDHHLILLNRTNADGVTNGGLNSHQEWKDAFVIDVWQGNLNARDGRPHAYMQRAEDHYYAKSDLKLFATFPPAQRRQHRAFALGLADTGFGPRNPALERLPNAEASAALRAEGVLEGGRKMGQTRNRKVGQRWVIEHLQNDGSWKEM